MMASPTPRSTLHQGRFYSRSLVVVLVLFLALGGWPAAGHAHDISAALHPAGPGQGFVPGRVLVRWRSGAEEQARSRALAHAGWEVLRRVDGLDLDVLAVPEGEEQAAVAALSADPAVMYAELDVLAYAAGADEDVRLQGAPPFSALGLQPNDTYWLSQWAPRRAHFPEAWSLSTGSPSVIVAVVDSGVDLLHPDYASRLLTGFDYVDWDSVPQDQFGHGSHVAGVIAAAGNDDRGVAGSAWSVQLLPLRVLDRNGVGSASTIAQAVLAASSRGAGVINLSLALSGPSNALHDAIISAVNNDCVVVAATGNDSVAGLPPVAVRYPAAYPEVLAVAATTHDEERASYSNGGPEVDVAAPGGEAADPIFSTGLNGSYSALYGTSIATAYASGASALLRGYAPSLDAAAVLDVLRQTADRVGALPYVGGRNDALGAGRIDADAALRWTIAPALVATPDTPTLLAIEGRPLPAAVLTLSNPSTQPLAWQVTGATPSWISVDVPQSGVLAYPASARLRISLNTQPPAGLYFGSLSLRATGPAGQVITTVITVRITATGPQSAVYLPIAGREMQTAAWERLTPGGIGLALADDGVQTASLPFNFPFYGRAYNQVYVHANGFLSFGQGYGGSAYAFNRCLPDLAAPNNAIFALWDDLDPSQGGQVSYVAGATYAVVEWRNVPNKAGSLNTFQVVLWADGQVWVQYAAVSEFANATVGMENWDASLVWPVACDATGRLPAAGQVWRWNTALP